MPQVEGNCRDNGNGQQKVGANRGRATGERQQKQGSGEDSLRDAKQANDDRDSQERQQRHRQVRA